MSEEELVVGTEGLENDEQVVDKPTRPPLPEGFNPADYGYVAKDEFDKVAQERDTLNTRLSDTQRSFHEDRSRLSQRLADIEQRIPQNMQSNVQVKSAAQLLQDYTRTNDPNVYWEYQQAQVREMDELRREIQLTKQQSALQADKALYQANASKYGVGVDELQNEFVNKPPSFEEAAVMYNARKSGGYDQFIAKVRNDAIEEFKKTLKVPQQTIPTGATGSGITNPEPDWEYMTDEEVLQAAKRTR